jgi:hypothetical protein
MASVVVFVVGALVVVRVGEGAVMAAARAR